MEALAALENRNHVIASLQPEAQEFFIRRAYTRQIFAGEKIYEEQADITHAVFPHAGLLSQMAMMADGRTVEKLSIGPNGFLGFAHIMGGDRAISTSVVRIAGYASWVSIDDLDEALTRFDGVRDVILRYARSLIAQLMETVACNSLHTAEQRIMRWLLIAHDSVQGDAIDVTQQAVAESLGLRRATVSQFCTRFQEMNVLDTSRGRLTILDRQGMEERVCECYHRIRSRAFR